MKTQEKLQLVDLLLRRRVFDKRKMISASSHIDKNRKKAAGWNSVEIIRKFRGAI